MSVREGFNAAPRVIVLKADRTVRAMRRLQAVPCISLLILCALCGAAAPAWGASCVILLHGMGRTSHSMHAMAEHLGANGFQVINADYPSTEGTVNELASTTIPAATGKCADDADAIHFVTHSLGGILVRAYYQDRPGPPGSRVVMLGPPNQGSEVAQKLRDWGPYQWVMGPAGQALGTTADSIPLQLKPIPLAIGVIAGTRSFNPLFSHWLAGPDDGKVSTERAKLAEMKDFITVNSTHVYIMRDQRVLEQTTHFLLHERFDHNEDQTRKKTVHSRDEAR